MDKCTYVVDNKTGSFAKKNYQHGKTAKNENTKERIEKHGGNKNCMIVTLENIGTHWNT